MWMYQPHTFTYICSIKLYAYIRTDNGPCNILSGENRHYKLQKQISIALFGQRNVQKQAINTMHRL